MNRWTALAQQYACVKDPYGSNILPLYQSATFCIDNDYGYDYSRSNNPTREHLQNAVAKLEEAEFAYAFSSGMAAINAVLQLLAPGDHIIVGDDLYGGSKRLLRQLAGRGVIVSAVDTSVLDENFVECISKNTKMILIETPTNPWFKFTDLKKIARIARQFNLLIVVDNTLLSPWLQQPLIHGADIVLHSATKHLSGHSDVTAGIVVTNDKRLAGKIAFIQNSQGAILAPFEAWLLLRGIKTLGLRIERQQQTAIQVAMFLQQCPVVKQVFYPGLLNDQDYERYACQCSGAGSVLSFIADVDIELLLKSTQYFSSSVSFGSYKSQICHPNTMSHVNAGIDQQLIRLSIGIEAQEDLIADLDQALYHSRKR